MSQLTALEWLALLHPVLAILFVYPVAGATIRLGILAREKRTDYNPALPDTVPTEHWQHGRWLVSSAVVITLWSYLVIAIRNGLGLNPVLWAAGLGTLAALLALPQSAWARIRVVATVPSVVASEQLPTRTGRSKLVKAVSTCWRTTTAPSRT